MWAGIRNCVCERYRKIIIHSVLCRFFMSTAVSSRINGTGVLLCHSSSNNNNFTGTSSKNAQPSKNYHLNALRPTNCCLILPTVFLSFSSGKPTTCFQIRFYCYLISWLFPSIHIYILLATVFSIHRASRENFKIHSCFPKSCIYNSFAYVNKSRMQFVQPCWKVAPLPNGYLVFGFAAAQSGSWTKNWIPCVELSKRAQNAHAYRKQTQGRNSFWHAVHLIQVSWNYIWKWCRALWMRISLSQRNEEKWNPYDD